MEKVANTQGDVEARGHETQEELDEVQLRGLLSNPV